MCCASGVQKRSRWRWLRWGNVKIIHKFLAAKIIHLNFPILSEKFAAPSVTAHNVGFDCVILVERGFIGTISTGMIQPNLITMLPTIVIIVSLVIFSYVGHWSASCCGWPYVALHPQKTSDFGLLQLGPDVFCFQLVSECCNCSRQGRHCLTVSRCSSGQVGHGSNKLCARRRFSLFIVLCHSCCVIACPAGSA
jgi:hypothetical protein